MPPGHFHDLTSTVLCTVEQDELEETGRYEVIEILRFFGSSIVYMYVHNNVTPFSYTTS